MGGAAVTFLSILEKRCFVSTLLDLNQHRDTSTCSLVKADVTQSVRMISYDNFNVFEGFSLLLRMQTFALMHAECIQHIETKHRI